MSNVYIIFGKEYSIDSVKKELIEEGYTHNFFFGFDKTDKEKIQALKFADEVWIFGNVEDILDYKLAVKLNKDIWIMG